MANPQRFVQLLGVSSVTGGATPYTGNIATAESPTTASLTGTWLKAAQTSSMVSSGVTTVMTETPQYTFTATTYTSDTIWTNTPSNTGVTTTSYSGAKGTYTLSGDVMTRTETYSRSSSSPFTDTTSGWIATSPAHVQQESIILSEGKVYGINNSPLKAQGTVTGLIGTWSCETYLSFATPYNYMKAEYIFTANTAVQNTWFSNTATYSATADSSTSSTYVDNGNGTITVNGSNTISYAIKGSYLFFGSTATDTTFGRWTKQ